VEKKQESLQKERLLAYRELVELVRKYPKHTSYYMYLLNLSMEGKIDSTSLRELAKKYQKTGEEQILPESDDVEGREEEAGQEEDDPYDPSNPLSGYTTINPNSSDIMLNQPRIVLGYENLQETKLVGNPLAVMHADGSLRIFFRELKFTEKKDGADASLESKERFLLHSPIVRFAMLYYHNQEWRIAASCVCPPVRSIESSTGSIDVYGPRYTADKPHPFFVQAYIQKHYYVSIAVKCSTMDVEELPNPDPTPTPSAQ
jgi:hypothetical protein